MTSLFEQNGGTYSIVGDYRIPNLAVPDEPEYPLGIWGKQRLGYLKNHQRVLYINLLTSGKLNEHLREIDATACEQHETIVRQMTAAQGVGERLKAEKPMLWVGKFESA